MTRGEGIRTAIQSGDTATLRRMANAARREEDRAFLALLAQFVDLHQKGKGSRKSAAVIRPKIFLRVPTVSRG
jgi:hypothetical protein